jgi:hypothetical protein
MQNQIGLEKDGVNIALAGASLKPKKREILLDVIDAVRQSGDSHTI